MRQALGATPAMLKRATAVKALRTAGAAALTGIVTMYGVLSLVSSVAEASGYFVPTTTVVVEGDTWLVALLSAAAAAGLVATVPAAWASHAPLATILTDRRPYGPANAPG